MKTFGGFLLVLLSIVVIIGAFGVHAYVSEMAPAWEERARALTALEVQDQQNAVYEGAIRRQKLTDALDYALIILMLGAAAGIGIMVWSRYDIRRESRFRAVDGTFALQSFDNNGQRWVVDPNKATFGAIGFDKFTGNIITDASIVGPDRQLEYVKAVQPTRTAAARQLSDIRNSAQAKYASGFYDREQKPVERQPDAMALPLNKEFTPLTIENALAQSTTTEWVLGQNRETGKVFSLNLREIVHFGIVGATGTGKTAYVAMLMMANALRSKWRVIILDGKGGADWSKFSQFVEYHSLDYTTVGKFLEQMTSEYTRRQEKLNEARVNSVWELTPMPRPTMVMIDEFGAVMDSLKVADPTEYKRVSLELGNLLRLSRSTGISMVFCDQDPSKWPSAMRANLPVNICFKLGGMKGNSVAEYNLNELERTAHFQVDGERYHAFETWRVIDSLMPSADYKKPKALLSADSSVVPSIVPRSVVPSRGEVDPQTPTTSIERNDGTTERTYTSTELQDRVWAWRDANPQGTQAQLRNEFAQHGIEISKTHVHRCWHEWPGNEAPAQPVASPTIQDLIAQYGEVRIGSERITTAVDKTQEIKYK